MAERALGQDSLVGQLLGHYRLVERIGEGGMGIVYRAHDLHLDNRVVAIKILPTGAADNASRQRFRKEAQALSKLNHPNIASVIDFDSCNGIDYLAEEFVDGLSLDQMLTNGALPENEVVSLGSQLCEGLAAAHEHGIIHRDIKPANIRVTSKARLKILDFGLAKTLGAPAQVGSATISASETYTIAGTWPYMSPEQVCGKMLDVRSDIWAVGCVLYEMVTGRRPFLGNGVALLDGILHQEPARPSKLNQKITPKLEAAILRCLQKEPSLRYSSVREITEALLCPASATSFEALWLRLRRWFVTLALAVGLMAVASIGYRVGPALWRILTNKPQERRMQVVPHESYLAGLTQLERWDKPDNLASAIRSFEQAVNADPSFALGFSGLGEAYWAKYRLDRDSRWIEEAEKNCRRAAELDSHLPAVYVTLSRVHNGKGEYNLALLEIQRALKLEPNAPDALLGEAAVYANMGLKDKAEDTYKRAATLRPQSWSGYYELGAFYYRQHRYTDAIAAFERVLDITPDNAMVQATLGGIMQLLRKDDEAEKHLLRSIELQPSYTAYTNLGALYYRQRRWAESASATRKALEINDKDWSAWSNLGLACEWLNRKEDADNAYHWEQVHLEEAAKINRDDPDLQIELSLLYSKQKLGARALPLLEAALARAPNDPGVLATAAEIYENLDDRSRALESVKKALANGFTLAQLMNDPGKQQLLLDPRFREIQRKYNIKSSPVQR